MQVTEDWGDHTDKTLEEEEEYREFLQDLESSYEEDYWLPYCVYTLGIVQFCQTLIYFGDYHSLLFWFSLAESSCLTPVAVQEERLFNVSVKNMENT